jgi:Rod binding domain-containing protein
MDFEPFLVRQRLKLMGQFIPQDELLGSSPGKEIYHGLIDQELAKMSQRGGVGLGEVLYRQVLQREEKARAGARKGPPEVWPKSLQRADINEGIEGSSAGDLSDDRRGKILFSFSLGEGQERIGQAEPVPLRLLPGR